MLEEEGKLVVAHQPREHESGGMQSGVSCKHALSEFGDRLCGRWITVREEKKRNSAQDG